MRCRLLNNRVGKLHVCFYLSQNSAQEVPSYSAIAQLVIGILLPQVRIPLGGAAFCLRGVGRVPSLVIFREVNASAGVGVQIHKLLLSIKVPAREARSCSVDEQSKLIAVLFEASVEVICLEKRVRKSLAEQH